jgi:hypothetical protein
MVGDRTTSGSDPARPARDARAAMHFRFRETHQAELSLRSLSEVLTVGEQVNMIAESYGGRELAEDVARTRAEFGQLSDDDVSMELTE